MERHLIALVVVFVSAVASAQMGGSMSAEVKNSTPEQRAKAWTFVMKDKLALTPEQLPKVEAINLDTAQKMEPVLKGSDGPLVKMRAAKQIETGRDGALQSVLTPQQFQHWQATQEEIKQKVEQKMAEKQQ